MKFRSRNLYTIIIVTKIKKDFLKKKRVKRFFIFFIFLVSLLICYDLSKLTTVRNRPSNKVVVGLLIFLTVRILYNVNMVYYHFFNSNSKWLYTLHAQRENF